MTRSFQRAHAHHCWRMRAHALTRCSSLRLRSSIKLRRFSASVCARCDAADAADDADAAVRRSLWSFVARSSSFLRSISSRIFWSYQNSRISSVRCMCTLNIRVSMKCTCTYVNNVCTCTQQYCKSTVCATHNAPTTTTGNDVRATSN